MFRLDGRVAVITGAASGIGAATARAFAAAGADVALAWFPGDPHDIEPVRAAVEAAGRRALVVEVDVARTEQVEALVARAVGELGRVDIAVANAGIARKVALADLDDAAWNVTLDVDLLGAFRLFRAALPHMREAGYGAEAVARVTELITKAAHRAGDAEGQALEDGLCLVFLETQYRDLAAKTPKEKMDDIVHKTLRKMATIAKHHAAALTSEQACS